MQDFRQLGASLSNRGRGGDGSPINPLAVN
jgi:hypothetical protein